MNEMMSMFMNILMMGVVGGVARPVMAQMSPTIHTQKEGDFNEVARIPLSDKTDLTISEVIKGGVVTGYSISKFVRTPGYTGYSKGIFIPKDKARRFLNTFDTII